MFWGADRQQSDFIVECARLRPGVPLVRARGLLHRGTVQRLGHVIERCLEGMPWAVVVDLTRLTELRACAMPAVGRVVARVQADYVGLHFVTSGGAVDRLLGSASAGASLVIHHSIGAVQRALGREG